MPTFAKSLLDRQSEEFERDGFLLAPQLFTAEEIAEIRETFMRQNINGPVPGLSDGHASADPSDPLSFYPRMMNPHRRLDLPAGSLTLRFLLDARLYPILRALMGEEPAASQSMFYFKPPKARGQELHQDNYYLRVKPGTCMAAWIAVDDVDAENGGMRVVSGSHHLDIACPEKADSKLSFTTDFVRVPEDMSAEHVDMKAGDVLFFNGSLIHGSTPNTSASRFRRSLIFHYVPLLSAELSAGYKPMTFGGEPVAIAPAVGGGPCGVNQPISMH